MGAAAAARGAAASADTIAHAIIAKDYTRRSPFTVGGRPGHKEWHHFCVLGATVELLVNFSLSDDIRPAARDGAEIARLTVLVREPRGWDGDVDTFDTADVHAGGGRIDLRFGANTLRFAEGAYRIRFALGDRPVSGELELRPQVLPTVAPNIPFPDGPPLHWVIVPRLLASGRVMIGGREHRFDRAPAYHDHNFGAFLWGHAFSWIWGFCLSGAPLPEGEDASEEWGDDSWTVRPNDWIVQPGTPVIPSPAQRGRVREGAARIAGGPAVRGPHPGPPPLRGGGDHARSGRQQSVTPSPPWTIAFVRLANRTRTCALAQGLFVWKGARPVRVFREHDLAFDLDPAFLRVPRVFKVPRVMALLSPEALPDVPRRVEIRAAADGDELTVAFEAGDLGQVVIPSETDLSVTIINEVTGHARIEGRIKGERVAFDGRGMCEFLST